MKFINSVFVMTKFQNKYRIESTRLQNYDYSRSGLYFVTICTQNKVSMFGEVINGEMQLNKYGEIIKSGWLKTPILRPDMKTVFDEYIIMPNHLHGILYFEDEISRGANCSRGANHCVSTKNKFGPQSKNLGSIIRGFKAACTKQINDKRGTYGTKLWQSNYYEHIIRNETGLQHIRQYIRNNPIEWAIDEYYNP